MILVFLANGTEEIEALTPVDLLRRAGVEVVTVGVGGKQITGSHGIGITCDVAEEDLSLSADLEGVVLPGGMPGTKHLGASPFVEAALSVSAKQNLLIAAICAAPSVLGEQGLLQGRRAVCFPGFESRLTGAIIEDVPVCRDGNIVTACGAGVALPFALALVAALKGEDKARALAAEIQCP